MALAVSDWNTFLRVREALITSGAFAADGPAHRLRFGHQRLDIIPFGGVERQDRSIAWSREDAEVGTTQGYQAGRPGFFVVPADKGSNNERCFVVTAATAEVSLL